MAAKITNYKCPACTGPIHFDSKLGKLKCDYCGSEYTAQEIEEFYAAKNEAAEAAELEQHQKDEADAAAAPAGGSGSSEIPEGFEEFAEDHTPAEANTENAGDGWSASGGKSVGASDVPRPRLMSFKRRRIEKKRTLPLGV